MTTLASGSSTKSPARLAGTAILACQSDDRLVALVREGHERAFEAIVDRYRKTLVTFARRILPESRTEDAVQQAFLNAHTAILNSDESVQLKPWLFTITRNAALNMLRQNGWNYEEIPLDFDGVRRPDQVVEQRIELQRTVAAVNELPERQRNALVMRELEGRSYEEIALALGTGDGAVRQLLNRARGSLRSIASAFIPPPLVLRAASALPPTDGRRAAEILGSLGAAGVAKAGATALVAGSLVVGAVEGPASVTHHHGLSGSHPTLSAHSASAPTRGAKLILADDHGRHGGREAEQEHGGSSSRGGHGRDDGSHHSGSHHARGETRHSGSDDTTRSGSGETRSGSDDSSTRSVTDDHRGTSGGSSGSGGSSTSGSSGSSGSGSGSDSSGSSGSGRSGSDDTTTVAGVIDDSSHSGSSVSGDTVSSTSGSSGPSGSGSDDSLSSGSGSGSSGSGSSGSGKSGSGSTSGSDDH